jgi:threonine aldolase
MQYVIDLRSDTVTKPTPAMRRAMAEAVVGDDVYGEDPTVNHLQELAANILGKEAALFVASGTMGNLSCILAHCGRGDEMIVGDQAHIFHYEQGGSAALGGVHPRPLANLANGSLDLDQVESAIRPDDAHAPVTRLIAVENTQNRCGGRVLTVEYMDAIGELAHRHSLLLHVDGARLWNAAVALGVPPARLVQHADSVTCCLSKGLAAPVGSVVAGSKAFIRKVHRARKALGGAMRQAGVIAAAGIVALDEMIERVAEDHANARLLAGELAKMDGIELDPTTIQTNIVYFGLQAGKLTPAQLSGGLAEQGVLINPVGGLRLRAVTHYHISASDIERTLEAVESLLKHGRRHARTIEGVYR